MKIKETKERGLKIEWTLKGRNKLRTLKNKKGITKAFQGVLVKIPYELTQLISNDGTYTYLYEHFEKIIVTPDKPPKNITSHRARLNKSSKNPQSNAITEIPSKFFDTSTMEYAKYTYYPNKKDYITGKKGVIFLETGGNNPRKHFKQNLDSTSNTITYPTYLYQTQAPEDLHFHEDLTQILNMKELYLYYYEDNTTNKISLYITSKKPSIECIHTTEEELVDELYHHNIIDDYTEQIVFTLYLNEYDPASKTEPMIKVDFN